jgi:hypothetical protein
MKMEDIESEMKSFLDESKNLMKIGFTVEDIKRMYEDRLENRINKLIKHNYENCLLRITDKED